MKEEAKEWSQILPLPQMWRRGLRSERVSKGFKLIQVISRITDKTTFDLFKKGNNYTQFFFHR